MLYTIRFVKVCTFRIWMSSKSNVVAVFQKWGQRSSTNFNSMSHSKDKESKIAVFSRFFFYSNFSSWIMIYLSENSNLFTGRRLIFTYYDVYKNAGKVTNFFPFELYYQLYQLFYCWNVIEIQWYTKAFVSNNWKKSKTLKYNMFYLT